MFYFKIIEKNSGGTLVSTFPDLLNQLEFNEWSQNVQIVNCKITKQRRRQQKIVLNDYIIFATSYGSDDSNKRFQQLISACIFFSENVFPKYILDKNYRQKRFRRLRHNIITLSVNISNELHQIFPEEFTGYGKNQLQYVADIISTDMRSVAKHLLKIWKSAKILKSEIDAFDILNSDYPRLDFQYHNLHKVINLSYRVFWIEFENKNIKVIISENYDKAYFDYTTFSVVLTHLLDNATKYIAKGSDFKISFENRTELCDIIFNMLSLKIEESELSNLSLEGYSGIHSREKGLSGDGLGMFVIDQLLKLNNGTLRIKINTNLSDNKVIDNTPYEWNEFRISLPRYG